MDSTHITNLPLCGHVQIELDHITTIVGHQTEFRITLIGADARDLHRQIQLKLGAGKVLDIGIQRRCLFRIHNQIGIIACISAHIQRNTGVAASGAAEEVTVGINHIVRRNIIHIGQTKSTQHIYIFCGHSEGLLALLAVCSERNQLKPLFGTQSQYDLITFPGLGAVSGDFAIDAGEDIDKIHTGLSLRQRLFHRGLGFSGRRFGL